MEGCKTALLSICKGDSSRIGTDVTPFEEGRVYFTADDGGLYVDSVNNGIGQRVRISAPGGGEGSCVCVYATLEASAWVNGRQVLSIEGIGEQSNGIVGLSEDITSEQLLAAEGAHLRIAGQGDGTVTIAADGYVPTIDIPCAVVIFCESEGGSGGNAMQAQVQANWEQTDASAPDYIKNKWTMQYVIQQVVAALPVYNGEVV